ncbi:glucans biosynthesis protein [Pseudoxanthobacter soli DSM 19599]|uniref:Glucans biosynthesis protein G n=1 Tax=Pseudoxanthobacter soli DSM 19599 TaxID=1123029 RepID=A0A1M7ZPP8_9HYPH|nr:glucans biosynthesis protein [Pseudoxanthobacter soli DSM 19599]
MRRRDFLLGSLAAAALAGGGSTLLREAEADEQAPATDAGADATPFDRSFVRKLARERAAKPYQKPAEDMPAGIGDLDYDGYRKIRFDPNKALWRADGLPFQAQFFHRGWLYKSGVDIFEVVDGKASSVRYRPEMFLFDGGPNPLAAASPDKNGAVGDIGFAGFRLHAPINRPDYFDEICVFLGASYFRAVGKGENYGLSARGLALKTAAPEGEEFPRFVAFWLERPAAGTSSIVVHALLDSESATAAYRFTIRPGDETVFDVEMVLYPRVDIDKVGLAPLTSMFLFGPSDRADVDDFRPAVHDSDGLAMLTGRGERIWRPLANPQDLQISVFADINPRGFGLMQRARDFADFEDLEARYDTRPSLWVEPIGDWGDGSVILVEIPTKEEIHDNIAAFWRPKAPIKAGSEYPLTYRLHWGAGLPDDAALAAVAATRSGHGTVEGARRFVLDFTGKALDGLTDEAAVHLVVENSAGRVFNPVVHKSAVGGWRASFELAPEDAGLVELRAGLRRADGSPLSETWLYRWTS